jgi:hypothetical protein
MRDSDIRAAARQHLSARHPNDPDTLIVEEMGLWSGSARIDLATINGELSGIELKSDRDTLDRLPRQAKIYGLVFDRVELIVGARHIDKAKSMIPNWWGVVVAIDSLDTIVLEPYRKARLNPSPNPMMIARLLWRDEALTILADYDLAKGWRSKPVKAIHQRLATELPFEELGRCVRATLKRRDGWLRKVGPSSFDMPIDP